MSSDTPEPQDPVRFSKAKSEPPILDLQAEKPASTAETSASKAESPNQDTRRNENRPRHAWPIGGFLGGLAGGAFVALGVFAYATITDSTPTQIAALESALIEKADRNVFAPLEKRLANIEAELPGIKADLGAIAEKTATPDPGMVKRITALENAIGALGRTSPQAVMREDRSALRLALTLSLRDAIGKNRVATKEITALEKMGESSAAFATLRSNLASPLAPFDDIRVEIERLSKSKPVETFAAPEQIGTASRVSSFFSQLVTVRPVGLAVKMTPPVTSFTPLLDAIDQNDAKAALAALAPLPASDAEQFNSIRSELERRLAVETALATCLDEALDAITKGDAP